MYIHIFGTFVQIKQIYSGNISWPQIFAILLFGIEKKEKESKSIIEEESGEGEIDLFC